MVRVTDKDHRAILRHNCRPTFNSLQVYLPPLPPRPPSRSDECAAAEILCTKICRTMDSGFTRIIAEIQKIVSKEKLPGMNVKEGWEPLCTILGRRNQTGSSRESLTNSPL